MSGTEITRRPSRESLLLSGLAGSVASMAVVAGGGTSGLVTTVGMVVLLVGISTARHGVVDAGGVVAFLGVVVAALGDASAGPVLAGTAATVVAWDAGGNAISLGRQLGREADTTRVEVLHALAGAAVGVTAAVVGLVLFRLGPTRQPVTTLFVLLLAGALLVIALNR